MLVAPHFGLSFCCQQVDGITFCTSVFSSQVFRLSLKPQNELSCIPKHVCMTFVQAQVGHAWLASYCPCELYHGTQE